MVVSVIALSLSVVDDPVITLVAGGFLILPTYVALGVLEARHAPLLLSPLSFYFFWYGLGLGLSAIYVGTVVGSADGISFSIAWIPAHDVAMGYVIFL